MNHKINTRIIFIIIIVLIPIFASTAQENYPKSFYGGLFFISHYLTTDEYKDFSKTHSDLACTDHIYETALKFFDNDISETCFCLTFALIPYNKILMKLPLIGTHVTIPLPSPPNSVFKEKLKNTPKNIFCDSPNDGFGDKDKLAHFFSNTFLKYDVTIFNLSDFLGIFVEYFEQAFFLQGGYDIRDIITNHIGEFFAKMLEQNKNAKPSDALKLYQLIYFRLSP